MYTLHFYIWIVLIVFSTEETQGRYPGLKSRITSRGFNYAVNVALDVLSKDVAKRSIPDQHGKSGSVSYDITGMRITKFKKPTSGVSLNSAYLVWKTSGIDIGLHGDFHYNYKKGIIRFSDHGSFDLSASGITLAINLMIGMGSEGRPTISASSCSCSVKSTDIKFHGGRAWIYNLFRGEVEKDLKHTIEGRNGMLCKQITKLVNVDGARKMSQLPVSVKFAKKFLLDYSFLSKPAISSNFMETYHKGQVSWLGGRDVIPFDAPRLPAGTSSSKMLYLWLSDYLFNTMSYSAFTHGLLTYNVTNKNIPGGVLNTTCETTCIGKIIPKIGKMFPNSTVMLSLNSSTMPNMTASNGSTSVNAEGEIRFYAMRGNGKAEYFLTLSAKMATSISITVRAEKVYARVLKLPITVKVKDSKIGPLNDLVLNFIVDNIVTKFVEPKLNELGGNGFPLPVLGSVKFTNTQLLIQENALLIATDVKYSQ